MSYDSASIHAPVTNAISVCIVLTLILMAGWTAEVVDVRGAFLHGQFTDGERVYMEVPRGQREHSYMDNLQMVSVCTWRYLEDGGSITVRIWYSFYCALSMA